MSIEEAKKYLARLEEKRKEWEPNNKRAYRDARHLASLVSLAEFGNEQISKDAIKCIAKI